MNSADFGASQHCDDNLGNSWKINSHSVAFGYPHGFYDTCKFTHLTVQSVVRVRTLIPGFTFPYKSQLIFSPGFNITVKTIINNVHFCSYKPFVERFIAIIKYFVPWLIPFKFEGPFSPETRKVLSGLIDF